MSDPNDISPEPGTSPQPDVLLVPAEFFFVERVEVPSAVTPGELADYAELSMESLAPFPLEQLRWGFLAAPDGRRLLIYAALNERLKRAGYKDLESHTWVLPDFASLHGARFAEAVEIVLHNETHDTRIFHPGGEELPVSVRSSPRHAHGERPPEGARPSAPAPSGAGDPQPSPDAPGRQPGSAAPDTSPDKVLRLRLLPVKLTEKSLPVFHFETLGEAPVDGHWSPLSPGEAELWQADIRPAAYKSVERKARRTTAWITRIMGYAALFALCLVLLEGLLFAGQLWLGTREAKVAAQSTAVRRIEDKQSLMNKLEQVARNELRPIAILRAANNIRRTLGETGIEYDETVIESGNRLTIEGKANTINELNAYTEALRQSGSFELIETKQLTRSGKTTFTATLDYLHGSADVGASLVKTDAAEPDSPDAQGPMPETEGSEEE